LPVVDTVVTAGLSAVRPAPTIEAPPAAAIKPPEPKDTIIQRLPPSGKLVYQFFWGQSRWLAGHATHDWVVKDGYYTLSSTVVTTGLFALLHPTRLVESAKGLVIGDKLRPLQFVTQLNEHPPAMAMFRWDRGEFRWFRNRTAFTQDLPADSYDKISFLYQLYLAQDKAALSSVHITMGVRLERYDIQNLGIEDIEIEAKAFNTLHLRKTASPNDASIIDVWLSKKHGLPLKITHSIPDGNHFEQLIAAESLPAD
jgi:hypothetical protein